MDKLNDLIFFITNRCNFKCATCFFVEKTDNKDVKTGRELTIDEIRKVSSSIGKLNTLYISGGEPFLREDLSEICRIFHLQNKVRNIHLPTNGYYTELVYRYAHRILSECPDLRLDVCLSLDGLPKTHDRIKGLEGSFEKTVKTAEELSSLKKKIKNLGLFIITVVNNMNLNEIVELSEFVKNNLPVDGHGPSPLRGAPYDKTLLPPTDSQWHDLSEKLLKYHEFWNKKNRGKLKAFLNTNRVRYLYDLYTYVLKNRKLPFECQAGNAICVLEPEGNVKLCELTDTIGNLRSFDWDLKKILTSERAIEMRKNIKGCACTHACFLNPSLRLHLPSLLKSYLWGRL